MDAQQPIDCPFCGFKEQNEYQMLLHIETHHSEDGNSPFVVKDAANRDSQQEAASQYADTLLQNSPANLEYVDCPFRCGERIPQAEIQFHVDLHLGEDMAVDGDLESSSSLSICLTEESKAHLSVPETFNTEAPSEIHRSNDVSPHESSSQRTESRPQRRKPSLKELFFGKPSPKKSSREARPDNKGQRAELGPYAHEKRMPLWLQQLLEEGGKVTILNKIGPDGTLVRVESIANETGGMINVLARLSTLDRHVARAFYCSSKVWHVAKLRTEGGFCGYRNIQMLISYIRDAKAPGHEHFIKIPSIIKLQEMIESAWDQGFNETGRVETGGIILTRKYIGTPEAQALMHSLDIVCDAVAFISSGKSQAYVTLLQAIFDYFDDQTDNTNRVVMTDRPPIYFQHKGHSMTIVGVEVRNSGSANLVVFDPMFNPSSGIKKLVDGGNFQNANPASLMKAHRRGEAYLSSYKEFEILKIGGIGNDG